MMSLDVLVVGTNFVDEYEVEAGEESASRQIKIYAAYIDINKLT